MCVCVWGGGGLGFKTGAELAANALTPGRLGTLWEDLSTIIVCVHARARGGGGWGRAALAGILALTWLGGEAGGGRAPFARLQESVEGGEGAGGSGPGVGCSGGTTA